MYLVLYDDECPFCKMLGELVAKRGHDRLLSQSWQYFQTNPPLELVGETKVLEAPADKLRVWDGQTLWEGVGAWNFLLENYDDLKGLRWLATKLGLEEKTAQTFEKAGRTIRFFCSRCGKRVSIND